MSAPRVLMATSMGGYNHATTLDAVLAQALELRGAAPEFLLCDAALPACQMTKKGRAAPEAVAAGKAMDYCKTCIGKGTGIYEPLGYPLRRLSHYVTPEDTARARELAQATPFAAIRDFRLEGMPVGDHAYAGALRYFARGDVQKSIEIDVLRKFFEAGLITVMALKRLFAQERFDVAVVHHGIYIPQGMIAEVARASGIRVVTYNPAYRKHSFIFSHRESYHYTMPEEPVSAWENLAMEGARGEALEAYLASRRHGGSDWIWFHDKPQEDIAPALRALGVDPAKPYVALLTSVVWDAQLHYKANAFPGMMDWIIKTIAYWRARGDLPLVIRVHPAEVRGAIPSQQKVQDEIRKHFGRFFGRRLPKNVFVVAPEDQMSTYALCERADAVIIYNTKTGVEVTAMGVPTIVAGEAWIRGKNISRDVSREEEYYRLLDTLPWGQRMSAEEQARAQRYAYHFFFRRMIPLPFITQAESANFSVAIGGKDDLAPGRWEGLDVICRGILEETPFIYDGAEHGDARMA